jgi:non-ribosomal peptide synthetase component F
MSSMKDVPMFDDVVARARQHSVGELLRRTAARYPDKIAVIAGEHRVTYREFDASVNRCADWTLAYGGRTRASMAFADKVAAYGDRFCGNPGNMPRSSNCAF